MLFFFVIILNRKGNTLLYFPENMFIIIQCIGILIIYFQGNHKLKLSAPKFSQKLLRTSNDCSKLLNEKKLQRLLRPTQFLLLFRLFLHLRKTKNKNFPSRTSNSFPKKEFLQQNGRIFCVHFFSKNMSS